MHHNIGRFDQTHQFRNLKIHPKKSPIVSNQLFLPDNIAGSIQVIRDIYLNHTLPPIPEILFY